jgi:hypothetical protein
MPDRLRRLGAYRNADILAQREAGNRVDKLQRASLAMGHMQVKLDGDIALISSGAGDREGVGMRHW